MNKTLLFVRHAQAGDAATDFERPLTGQGERDSRHLGFWLLEKYPQIDYVVSSNALRAITTTRNICEVLKISKIFEEEELYEASVRTMLEVINSIPEDKEMAMIVGHNPTISYCADYLCSSPTVSMEPGSLISTRIEGFSWKEISQGSATFVEFVNNHTYR